MLNEIYYLIALNSITFLLSVENLRERRKVLKKVKNVKRTNITCNPLTARIWILVGRGLHVMRIGDRMVHGQS